MKSSPSPVTWKLNALFAAIIGFVLVLAIRPSLPDLWSGSFGSSAQTLKTMLISIVLEAVPFLLLGVFVSSLIQAFVPESWIRRIIPRNPLLGVLVACLLGVVFPVCECGLIPIVRRLIAKGMPLYAGVVFILVGPIVNPVVYSATWAAFPMRPDIVYARMGLAAAVGAVIGLAVYFLVKRSPLKDTGSSSMAHTHHAHHTHHGHDHAHVHSARGGKLEEILKHAGNEFFDMGKYLILGSLITACIQSFIPRSELIAIGQGEVGSHVFMMGFAYILSLCSTADAFVASSFSGTFAAGSLLTFLVFGPMIDFKGTLMLLSVFKKRFVLYLSALVCAAVLAGSWLTERMFLQ